MAQVTMKTAGNMSTAGNWEPAEKPAASKDAFITSAVTGSPATIGTTSISARSLDTNGFAHKLVMAQSLVLGTSTSPEGKGAGSGESSGTKTNIILRISTAAGFEWEVTSGTLEFTSTAAEEQKIKTGGKTMPAAVFKGAGSKYILDEAFTSSSTVKLETGTLNLNGQALQCTKLIVGGSATRELKAGSATITLTGTGSLVEGIEGATKLTLSLASATILITDTSAAEKELTPGVGASSVAWLFGALTVSGDNVRVNALLGSSYGTLNVNTARAPVATLTESEEAKGVKVTFTAATATVTVTEGNAKLAAGMELSGTGLATGTELLKEKEANVWEINKKPTGAGTAAPIEVRRAGLVLIGATLTEVTTFAANGKAGQLARLSSNLATEKAELRIAGKVSVDYMVFRNIKITKASETLATEFYAGTHSIDAGGNEGIKFEAPTEPAKLELNAAASTSAASLAARATPKLTTTAASTSAATLALRAAPHLVFTGLAASAATAKLTAPTQVLAEAAVSGSAATLNARANAKPPLTAAASTSTAHLTVETTARVPLASAASASAASAHLHAPQPVVLSAAESTSRAQLGLAGTPKFVLTAASESKALTALAAKTRLPLTAASSQSTASARVEAALGIITHPASAQSAASASPRAAPHVSLTASSTSAAQARIAVEVPLGLGAAASASAASAGLRASAKVATGTASGASASVVLLHAPTRVVLSPAASQASGTLTVHTQGVRLALGAARSESEAEALGLRVAAALMLAPASSVSFALCRPHLHEGPSVAKTTMSLVYEASTELVPR